MEIPAKLYGLTAVQAIKLIRNSVITVEQYARALSDRVKERDGVVKAWEHFDIKLVLEQAQALDRVPYAERGPLHGAVIAVKDIIDTKEYGSEFYKGNRPNRDASAIALLRNAGALIFGKTTTTEFTVLNSGPDTTNPHDPNRTPGGSSAGSAAAVADFQVPLSLGTQTGGSVIRPASFTGVFAIKLSWNAVSLGGIKPVAPTLDSLGIFARDIEDLQLVVNALTPPSQDVTATPLRLALCKTPMWPVAQPATIEAMERTHKVLMQKGVGVTEIFFPPDLRDATAINMMHQRLFGFEAQISFLEEYRINKCQITEEIRDLVENKSGFTSSEVKLAADQYAALRPIFDQILSNFSAIVTPSAIGEAPLGLEDMGDPDFNFVWTGLHMPVVHIPAFSGPHGMPVGISLVAARLCDHHLLEVAKAVSLALIGDHAATILGRDGENISTLNL